MTPQPGHYARKQINSPSNLIAWSHRRRFEFAVRAVTGKGTSLLDYGCGDGTFAFMVRDHFTRIVGADVDAEQTADCARRLKEVSDISFVTVADLSADHTGQYDCVTCMETLEHCTEKVQRLVLADLIRLVKPSGLILISVPIEIGPSLLIKQVVRRIAGWRGLGDYRHNERYTFRELTRMLFAGAGTKIERPEYLRVKSDPDTASHGHKGFNWRRLKATIAHSMQVRQTRFTPLGWTRGVLSSQCWFFCAPRS